MKITDSNGRVAAFSTQVLHSNQKHRQNTIEIYFVKLKDLKKKLFFIDLLEFLETLIFPAQL